MVVLVKEDGLGTIAGNSACSPDHFGNAIGVAHTVTVQEQKVGCTDYGLAGNLSSRV